MKKNLFISFFTITILSVLTILFRAKVFAVDSAEFKRSSVERNSMRMGFDIDELGVRFADKSPLHLAVIDNDLEKVKELVSAGADINAKAKKVDLGLAEEFYTPLHYAIFYNLHEIINYLVDQGAEFDVPGCMFALRMAVENSSEETINLLIDLNADVNVKSCYDGRTALFSTIDHKDIEFGMNILDLLIQNGAEINIRDNFGYTPLMCAAYSNNILAFNYLISKGADVSEVHEDFGGMLFFAVRSCTNSEVVKKLVREMEVDVNQVDPILKRTPIFYAIENENSEVVKELIRNGARIKAIDKNKNTLLHMIRTDNPEFLELAQSFIEKGANIDAEDTDGQTPLFVATMRGLPEYCKLLIQNNANLNVVDDIDNNLLHALCASEGCNEKGMLEVGKIFIERKVKIDEQNIYGSTPIFEAIRNGAVSFCNLLVKSGADLSCKDREGNTLLHFIGKFDENGNFLDLATNIIQKGLVDINSTNKQGLTPLDSAVENIHLSDNAGSFFLLNGGERSTQYKSSEQLINN